MTTICHDNERKSQRFTKKIHNWQQKKFIKPWARGQKNSMMKQINDWSLTYVKVWPVLQISEAQWVEIHYEEVFVEIDYLYKVRKGTCFQQMLNTYVSFVFLKNWQI